MSTAAIDTTHRTRIAGGTRAGGQFANEQRAEAVVDLAGAQYLDQMPAPVRAVCRQLLAEGARLSRTDDDQWQIDFTSDRNQHHSFEVAVEDGVASPSVYLHWAYLPIDPQMAEDGDHIVHVDWSRTDDTVETLLSYAGRHDPY